ncbi:MAG TPA: hypothetical protein VGE28_13155 [Pseudomonas sp.]
MIISPWRKVRELHDSFKHSQSGLGVAAQLIIAIIMSAMLGPMAMGAMGGAATSGAAAGLTSGLYDGWTGTETASHATTTTTNTGALTNYLPTFEPVRIVVFSQAIDVPPAVVVLLAHGIAFSICGWWIKTLFSP